LREGKVATASEPRDKKLLRTRSRTGRKKKPTKVKCAPPSEAGGNGGGGGGGSRGEFGKKSTDSKKSPFEHVLEKQLKGPSRRGRGKGGNETIRVGKVPTPKPRGNRGVKKTELRNGFGVKERKASGKPE